MELTQRQSLIIRKLLFWECIKFQINLFLKKAAKLESGSSKPGLDIKGSVTMADVRKIAEAKMKDLNANDIDAAMKIIAGSARSMGLEVKG